MSRLRGSQLWWTWLIHCNNKKLHCQFSGGGDLLIKTDRRSCVVQNKIEDGAMSPTDPGTAVQHLGVEMKKGDCNLEDLH